MARIRAIKPDFFRHLELYNAEIEAGLPLRVAYAGLWTVADREGRFRWRPEVLKLDVLPFDSLDFTDVLNALCKYGFIERYEVGGTLYAHIPTFQRHQIVNIREAKSLLPAPHMQTCACTCTHMTGQVQDSGEQEQEQEHNTLSGKPDPVPEKSSKKQKIPFDEIIGHLNKKASKNFKPDSKTTKGRIKDRFAEGFTLSDFITVINRKVSQWSTDPKMAAYLRPETLFGPKFESYLNESGEPMSSVNPMREFRADDPTLNANPERN